MKTPQDQAPGMRRRILAFTTLVSLIAGACAGAVSPSVPSPAPATPSPPAPSEMATPRPKLVVGGDRPVTVHVPASYDASQPAPLVILLHGYTDHGLSTDGWFRLAPAADARGFVYAYPDGTIDSDGYRFWNATNACCNFGKSAVDDVAYLTSVIAEIQAKLAIDPKRIAFVGHSNGGFMSYRMACDQAGLVAAIVSLAGATFADPADCAPSEPVSVAQIHGTADDVIRYEGGGLTNGPYPAAAEDGRDLGNVRRVWQVTGAAQRQGRCRRVPDRRSRPGRDVGRGVVGMQVRRGGPALDDPGRRPRTGHLAVVRRLGPGLPGRPSKAVAVAFRCSGTGRRPGPTGGQANRGSCP